MSLLSRKTYDRSCRGTPREYSVAIVNNNGDKRRVNLQVGAISAHEAIVCN